MKDRIAQTDVKTYPGLSAGDLADPPVKVPTKIYLGPPASDLAGPVKNNGHNTTIESIASGICEPIEVNLRPKNYPADNPDTIMTCVYDNIVLYSGYTGDRSMQYLWSDGSTNHELTLQTSGIGIDIQKIWLDLTDPQTGCGYSDTLVVVYNFGSCVGVEDKNQSDWSVRIFPNPTSDILQLEYSEISGPIQFQISNIAGQIVYEESITNDYPGTNQIQFNLHSLPGGLYLVRIVNHQASYTEKILLY